MLEIKRTLEEENRTFTIKCQTTYGYPKNSLDFHESHAVTRARQESENKDALGLLLYGLLCWTMSGALRQNISYQGCILIVGTDIR